MYATIFKMYHCDTKFVKNGINFRDGRPLCVITSYWIILSYVLLIWIIPEINKSCVTVYDPLRSKMCWFSGKINPANLASPWLFQSLMLYPVLTAGPCLASWPAWGWQPTGISRIWIRILSNWVLPANKNISVPISIPSSFNINYKSLKTLVSSFRSFAFSFLIIVCQSTVPFCLLPLPVFSFHHRSSSVCPCHDHIRDVMPCQVMSWTHPWFHVLFSFPH